MSTLSKNQTITIEVSALGTNGEGIAKHGNYTIFVPFVCLGETVLVRITHSKGNVAHAKVEKIIKSDSCGRVSPKCKVFTKCGGCQIQHYSYEKQLDFKQKLVEGNLKKIGKLDEKVLPVVASDKNYGYRNKLQLPVFPIFGELSCGFYALNTHSGVTIDICPLHDEFCEKLISTIKEYAKKYNIQAYDHTTNKGLLRHIIARVLNNQMLLTIVINGNDLPNRNWLIEKLKQQFESFGLFISQNTKQTNAVTVSQAQHIYGLENIKGSWQGLEFSLKPDSFFQINTFIKDKLYTAVKSLIEQDTQLIIDAYAGAGLLSGFLSSICPTIGIELASAATADANILAERNNLQNLTNQNGDTAVFLPQLLETHQGKKTTIVLDPPRKGVDKTVIDALNKYLPSQIIYISCDSATLARDLSHLKTNYSLTLCQPFDMFPQTKHVETLVCLRFG